MYILDRVYVYVTCMNLPLILGKEANAAKKDDTPLVFSPFTYLQDPYGKSGKAAGTYASIYELLIVIGMIGIVVSLTIGISSLGMTRNGAKRTEKKDAIIFKMGLAVALFAVLTIASFILGFLRDFFS